MLTESHFYKIHRCTSMSVKLTLSMH